ncbi:hypothetical protein HOY82DRAFT_544916 [Tuber indicum]|nr:hypothetical protein HOY82DRAFT_544916 [Tuber indicum]
MFLFTDIAVLIFLFQISSFSPGRHSSACVLSIIPVISGAVPFNLCFGVSGMDNLFNMYHISPEFNSGL